VLANSRILLIGAGALGNEVVKNLAQCGIGHIAIVDHDSIEPTNLNRCVFFQPNDVGNSKAEVLASKVNRSFINTEATSYQVMCEDIDGSVYEKSDVVVSCVDNIDTRLTINRYCSFFGKPLIDGGTTGFNGRVQTVMFPDSACLDCRWRSLAEELTQQRHRCGHEVEILGSPEPALGITTSAVAAVQSNEVVKMANALNAATPDERDSVLSTTLIGKMWVMDLVTNLFAVYNTTRDTDCPYHDFGSTYVS